MDEKPVLPGEAHPPTHHWYVEVLDGDHWVPNSGVFNTRSLAEERLRAQPAKWADGTPVLLRLVRETTSYTAERARVNLELAAANLRGGTASTVPLPSGPPAYRRTVEDVDSFAAAAHRGQVDKIGVPYIEHVRAVAAGLAPFGDDLVIAGLLHDVLEDTDWTAEMLQLLGVSARALAAVEAVTNQPGVPYEEKIRRITSSPDAVLVKIADNAHNSRPDRAAQLPPEKRERLAAKYRAARAVLWPAAGRADIEAIVSIVNPALLAELGEVDA